MCKQSQIPTYIFIGVIYVFYTSSFGFSTAKSIYLVNVVFKFLVTVHLKKYRTRPATPLKVQYYFQKLGNLNLMVLFSVKMPAGQSYFEEVWNYVQRFLSLQISVIENELPRYPIRLILTPKCQYFLVSFRVSCTVPLTSSFPSQTGNLTLSPFLVLYLNILGFSFLSRMMSISTEPVSPPKKLDTLSYASLNMYHGTY